MVEEIRGASSEGEDGHGSTATDDHSIVNAPIDRQVFGDRWERRNKGDGAGYRKLNCLVAGSGVGLTDDDWQGTRASVVRPGDGKRVGLEVAGGQTGEQEQGAEAGKTVCFHGSFLLAQTNEPRSKKRRGANLTHPNLRHREAPVTRIRQAAPDGRVLGWSGDKKIRGFQIRP